MRSSAWKRRSKSYATRWAPQIWTASGGPRGRGGLVGAGRGGGEEGGQGGGGGGRGGGPACGRDAGDPGRAGGDRRDGDRRHAEGDRAAQRATGSGGPAGRGTG